MANKPKRLFIHIWDVDILLIALAYNNLNGNNTLKTGSLKFFVRDIFGFKAIIVINDKNLIMRFFTQVQTNVYHSKFNGGCSKLQIEYVLFCLIGYAKN